MAMMCKPCLATLHRRKDGVAAIEFAFIAPVLMLLIVIGVDVGRYIYATQQISRVANTIAQMVTSRSAPRPTDPVTASDSDLQFIRDSAMVIFPDVLLDAATKGINWTNDIAISISSVSFLPGPAACNGATCTIYVPKVIWSGGTTRRSCTGTMNPAPDTDAPSVTTLPVNAFPAAGTGTAGTAVGNIVVVDISYTYSSIWSAVALSLPMPAINRSVYVAPRYSPNGIIYNGGAFATLCP